MKKNILFITLFVFMLMTISFSSALLTDGIKHYWTFDETNCNIVDSIGTMNGTNSGASSVVGLLGNACDFESTESDFIELGDEGVDNQMTVSMWVNIETDYPDGQGGILYAKDVSAVRSWSINLVDQSGNNYQAFQWGISQQYGSSTNLSVSNWYHIVYQMDDTTNAMKFWVNGANVGNATNTGTPSATTSTLFIGKREYIGAEGYFDGKIDELAHYNRTLTSSEILELYNGGTPLNPLEEVIEGKIIVSEESANTTYTFPQTNDYVNHTTRWDSNATLSSYIFSWNNSGTWINDTPTFFTGTTNYSITIKQITQSYPNLIGWMVYANDSEGKWNSTEIQNYEIHDSSEYSWNTDLDNGLFSYYDFEELSNPVLDAVNNYNGTSVGLTKITGKIGNAYYYDGTSSYINLGTNLNSQLSGDFTINCWTYGNSTGTGHIVSDWASNFLWYAVGDGTVRTVLKNGIDSTVALSENAWHMQTLRREEGVNGSFFIDNVLKTTGADGGGTSTVNITIGSNGVSETDNWVGMIDECAFYNRSISDSEIDLLYNNGIGLSKTVIPVSLSEPFNYSNVGDNSTGTTPKINEAVLHSAYFNTNATLSSYIFSTNSSGSWVNDTSVGLSGSSSWINVTKIITAVKNTIVGWMVYVNDTESKWNSTAIINYIVQNTIPKFPFSLVLNSSSGYQNDSFLINVSVNDSDGLSDISSVYATIETPTGAYSGLNSTPLNYIYSEYNPILPTDIFGGLETSSLYEDGIIHQWYRKFTEIGGTDPAFIAYHNSSNGINWSVDVNTTMPNPELAHQLSYVINVNDVYYQFMSNYTGAESNHNLIVMNSTDKINWEYACPSTITTGGFQKNPTVWYNETDGVWHGLFEQGSGSFTVWYWNSTSLCSTWNKFNQQFGTNAGNADIDYRNGEFIVHYGDMSGGSEYMNISVARGTNLNALSMMGKYVVNTNGEAWVGTHVSNPDFVSVDDNPAFNSGFYVYFSGHDNMTGVAYDSAGRTFDEAYFTASGSGSTNITLSQVGASAVYQGTYSDTSELGFYNVTKIYVNDTSNAFNYSTFSGVNFLVSESAGDTTAPNWTTIPSNATINYLQNWDGVQFVATDETELEGYYVNDTIFTINSTGFLVNSSTLSAGIKTILITANDTSNNKNYTTYKLTVSQLTSNCQVLFNETSPLTYPSQYKVYSDCDSAFTLYKNGTSISNNSVQNSGVGYWNFSVQRTDTLNYSNTYDDEYFTVNGLTGDCSIYLNATSPIIYPEKFVAYTNCTSTYTMKLNGTTISNGTTIDSGAGYYNISVERTDLNYTNIYDQELFTVSQATTSLSLSGTTPITVGTAGDFEGTLCPSEATCNLYRNNTAVSNPDTSILLVGAYQYIYNNSATQNYTADSDTSQLIVSTLSDNCQVLFNETSPQFNNTAFTVYTDCTTGFQIYRNGTSIGNNSVQYPLNSGNYNYTVTRNDSTNYTNNFDDEWFLINDAESIPTLDVVLSSNNQLSNLSNIDLESNGVSNLYNIQNISLWTSYNGWALNETVLPMTDIGNVYSNNTEINYGFSGFGVAFNDTINEYVSTFGINMKIVDAITNTVRVIFYYSDGTSYTPSDQTETSSSYVAHNFTNTNYGKIVSNILVYVKSNANGVYVNVSNATSYGYLTDSQKKFPPGLNITYSFSKLFTEDTLWNVEYCDTVNCSFASSNYTLIGGAETFNSSTYETKSEIFSLNDSNSSITSVYLDYNGTEYLTTKSGVVYSKTLNIPTGVGTNQIRWKINYGASNKYTTYSNQVVALTNFSLCDGSLTDDYLNISFQDGTNLTTLSASIPYASFVYYLGSGTVNKTYTYSKLTDTYTYSFCSNVNQSLKVDSRVQYIKESNYPQVIWDLGEQTYTSALTNQTLFLLESADGIYVTFQVLNSGQDAISGATVTATREISGSDYTVASGSTDSAGLVTFWLNPDYLHDFSFTKSGFTDYTSSFYPTQTSYTITMGESATVQSSLSRGIKKSIIPTNSSLLNDTTYTFGFNLTSSYWDLDSYGFGLRLSNGTSIIGDTTSTSGTPLTISLNTENLTLIYMDYYWIINGTTTSGTTNWKIYNLENSDWSIRNFFDDLGAYLDTEMFGIDSFGRNLLIFLMIFVSVGLLGYKFGIANPVFISGLTFGVIFFLDIGVGIIPAITILSGTTVDHLLTFVSGLIFVVVVINEVYRS